MHIRTKSGNIFKIADLFFKFKWNLTSLFNLIINYLWSFQIADIIYDIVIHLFIIILTTFCQV